VIGHKTKVVCYLMENTMRLCYKVPSVNGVYIKSRCLHQMKPINKQSIQKARTFNFETHVVHLQGC